MYEFVSEVTGCLTAICILAFFALIVWLVVQLVRKSKWKTPLMFIAVDFVIIIMFSVIGTTAYTKTDEYQRLHKEEKEDGKQSVVEDRADYISVEAQMTTPTPEPTPEPTPTHTPMPEILFCGIPWGTNFVDVKDELDEYGLWGLSGEGYKTMSVDDIVLGDYQGINFEYGDINIIGNCHHSEIEVAGYKTKDIQLFFAYIPVDGILTKEEQDSALYGARYEFETQNLKEMYADLSQKLSSLYGEAGKTTTDSDLWGNSYKYTYWFGLNDTMVVLKYLDSENDLTGAYSDTIYISYVWNKGDELLQQASDILKQEAIENEKSVYGDSNTNGL